MNTTRCVVCRTEFTDEEIRDVTSCPVCQSHGVPMAIKNDTTIKINTHELRILTIWADNWAESIKGKDGGQAKAALNGILAALKTQVDVPLTLSDEFQQLANKTGSKIEIIKGGKTTEIKPGGEN